MRTQRRTAKQCEVVSVLACVAALLAGPVGPAGGQQTPTDAELPANVVIPHSRTYAYTTQQQGAVSQSMNLAMQRAQDVLNRDSSYLNSQLERTRIVNAQQANDLTFYFKDGRWIDSRLAEIQAIVTPHRTVEFGSEEFFDIASRLAGQNRQGALAFAQDILLLLDGEILLIDIPADVEEEYKPVDPRETELAGGSTVPPMRAGR